MIYNQIEETRFLFPVFVEISSFYFFIMYIYYNSVTKYEFYNTGAYSENLNGGEVSTISQIHL